MPNSDVHAILGTAHEAFVSMDREGRITAWNPAAEHTFGWTREEAIGTDLATVMIPKRLRAAHRRGLAHLLKTGEGPVLDRRIELTAVHRSGAEFPVEATISASRLPGHEEFNAFLHDISSRKRTEGFLAQAQRLAHIGSWEWDIPAGTLSWSAEMFRIVGADPAVAPSLTAFLARVHPEDRTRVNASLEASVASGEPTEFEHRIVRPDGQVREVECRGEVVTSETRALKMFGTLQDITQAKRRRDEVTLSRELAFAVDAAASVKDALTVVLRRICEHAGFALGQAWMPAPDGEFLEWVASWMRPDAPLTAFTSRSRAMTFERSIGVPGTVWESGEPVWRPDMKTDPTLPRAGYAREAGIGAAFGVPVTAGESTVAVLEFFATEPLPPDPSVLQLVTTVAAQLATMVERKLAEAALRTSEERFRMLVESLEDHAIFMLDREGCVASWNPGAHRVTGYAADEVMGCYVSRFYSGESVEQGDPEKHLERAIEDGRFEQATWLVRRDGLRYRAEIAITPLRNGDPAPRGFGCVIRDVTERSRVEQELRRLHALADGSHDAVFSLTAGHGVVTSWNRGAERLLGYREREVLGRSFSALSAREGQDALAAVLGAASQSGRNTEERLRLARKNGSVVDVALVIAPTPTLDGECDELTVVARDVSEQNRAEQYMAHTFGTYLDREIADHILREGPNLKARKVDVTMMFVDVRGFTAFAERFEPTEVVETLNCLFDLVVPIIAESGGHVDKFVGDGLLAVFGTPERLPNHADRAVQAAVKIAREARRLFQGDLEIGIGIDSGTVVAGNVGGGGRLDFTVIGDAVNTAARIESVTRDTGDTILFSAQTRAGLTDPTLHVAARGAVAIRGKRGPVELFSLDAAETVDGSRLGTGNVIALDATVREKAKDPPFGGPFTRESSAARAG